MVKHFHHRCEVALFLKFAWIHVHQLKEFIGVHEVEIAGQRQVSCRNSVPLDEGMAKFHIVSSLCAIAQMSQEQFTHKGKMAFHKTGMIAKIGIEFLKLVKFLSNFFEDIGNRLWFIAAHPREKWIPWFYLTFDRSTTSTILSAVVLL